MNDYTGMFKKVAGADFEFYKLAKSNSEMLWEQLNSQGKRDIDANAREASWRVGRVDAKARRSKLHNIMRATAKIPTPRRAELGRDLVRGSSELMKRKGMIPTNASQTFKNPVFAAANASHAPSMSGIFANAAKRRLFK